VISDYFTISAEMKARCAWMGYKRKPRVPPDPKGKMDKPPYDALTGHLADCTDPEHWCAYPDALAAVKDGAVDGLGYVLSEEDPYTLVDLDECRDPATDAIDAWALDIIRRLDSYTEVSVSGMGVHVLVKAKLPPGGRKRGYVEMYDDKRFLVMTGQHLPETPVTINERQAQIDALHAEVWPTKEAQAKEAKLAESATPRAGAATTGRALSDAEVLHRATDAKNGAKVATLYSGDRSGYSSPSEADYALIGELAFYTQDADQLERLMRGSGLNRPEKWDGRNGQYASTLRRDIETLLERDRAAGRETYTPGVNGHTPHERNETPQSRAERTQSVKSVESVESRSPQGDSTLSTLFTQEALTYPQQLAPAAFYGLAGDIVDLLAPETEADPVA
jgi:putative DNA primase/helicase